MTKFLLPFLLLATAAQAQIETPDGALARDAATWAAVAGLPVDEAERQLRAQGETIAVTDAIAAEFGNRLTGIAIEHRPRYLIRVLLTGSEPVPDRRIVAGGLDVAVEFRTDALATRAQLLAALSTHQAAIRASLRRAPGLGVDQRNGSLVVMVGDADAAAYPAGELEQRFANLTGMPVTVRRLDTTADAAIEGGARVVGTSPVDGKRYACTTGFVVTDGGRLGVVTAAHCPDTLAYVEADRTQVPLSFVGQWGWSFQDVQLHLASAEASLAPSFFADTAKTLRRAVTAARPRASTRAGDVVCHRGERTGYSCAEVEYVDFAPSGDLCGGPCAPTWVAVAGPSCRAGDSGGPVFDGTVALGLVKGSSYRPDGACSLYYYQSTDFLPDGWRVLVAPDPPRNGEGDRSAQPSGGGASPPMLRSR
ncbi:hypothetical protein [Sphingomonas bacterium]|uniref:hypothetical protein n=1 Tax=Sphingomonas bacterium TaxID=1895847 RepID=UPI00262088CB|nr:hypothetical protein [Sphingomonas bacterium]